MAQSKWIGTRWRSVSVSMRFGDVRIGPGDDFTFTEDMAARGLDPDQWALAGNAEFIPAGVTLPPAPKGDDALPAAADADTTVAPAGRRGRKVKWETTYTDDADVAVVAEVDDGDAGA